jgi:hypothetical protein
LSENSTTEPALSDKGTASDTMSSGARNLRRRPFFTTARELRGQTHRRHLRTLLGGRELLGLLFEFRQGCSASGGGSPIRTGLLRPIATLGFVHLFFEAVVGAFVESIVHRD